MAQLFLRFLGVDFISRAKASENEDPNLVDKDDEIPFRERVARARRRNPPGSGTGAFG